MTPFYHDDWLTLYGGDCKAVLSELTADSVDCVVTSPPYWGLRDYGTATWSGGDEACDHKQSPLISSKSTLAGYTSENVQVRTQGIPFKDTCGKCGATRQDSQLGLERTPEEYVANMVAVFAEVRRVLKPSGTCWLNLGDSYARDPGKGQKFAGGTFVGSDTNGARTDVRANVPPGLKPKDLVGIPWRVAFALQADGWYLRSDIIWAKPNPMPESVTDRPTKAHEYLFLLTKSARYFFDSDAVREAHVRTWDERNGGNLEPGRDYAAEQGNPINGGAGKRKAYPLPNPAGRNIRSVWTIATRPYPGAHFAVFPPELPERCIKAGSSERGVCPECGAPWERVIEKSDPYPVRGEYLGPIEQGAKLDGRAGFHGAGKGAMVRTTEGWSFLKRDNITTGWRPTCDHPTPALSPLARSPLPAVVLDPFAGSGTVGLVANRLSRRAILVDLNPTYLQQQMDRNAQTPLGLTEGDVA